MKKKLVLATLLACSLILITAGANAQGNAGTFFGKMYFDYNHDFSSGRDSLSGRRNGFEFTRIYFGYDRDLNENFSIRFLLDVDNTKDANNKTAWRPLMKNAYLSGKCVLAGGARWYVGMVPTALTNVPEANWGYRSIYKMPMDQMGWGSTADLGLYWKGLFVDMLQVEFNLINGGGYKAIETDMFKLFDLRPTLYLLDKSVIISAYGSYRALNDSSNVLVGSGFGGYEMKLFRVGVEYSLQDVTKASPIGKDVKSTTLAGWGSVNVMEKLSLLARYDWYDPNTDVKNDESALLIGGVDFHPAKNVRIIPNVQIMTFKASDNPQTPDVNESKPIDTAYITFEYNW